MFCVADGRGLGVLTGDFERYILGRVWFAVLLGAVCGVYSLSV